MRRHDEVLFSQVIKNTTGKKLTIITTGSELLLAYEISKYIKKLLGKDMSFGNIKIDKELQSEYYFSFIISKGLNVGFDPDPATLKDYSDYTRFFFTGTVDGIVFKESTPEKVVYEYYFDSNANRVLHGENRSAGYVSLVAFLIVEAFREGRSMPKLVIDHGNYNQQELEYSDILVLMSYGAKLLDGLLDVYYSTAWGLQPDWEAFIMYNRQRGAMNREYTISEKYQYLKKNYVPGDVVLLYRRSRGAKGNTIKQLKSCYPAVIRGFDFHNIQLSYYPTVATLLTHTVKLDMVAEEMEADEKRNIYTPEDYARFEVRPMGSSLTEIGCGLRTWNEQVFFVDPIETDGTYQYFRREDWGVDRVWLSTLDTIYAVFEDRKVEYNKEKFLHKYFYSQGREPVYHKYVKPKSNLYMQTDG